jgi:hypothetical protein
MQDDTSDSCTSILEEMCGVRTRELSEVATAQGRNALLIIITAIFHEQ